MSSINQQQFVPTPAQLHKIQQLSTTTVAMSASWLSVTHASRWCHVATSISVSRALTKCSARDVVVPSAVLELTWYCDFTNVQLFWWFFCTMLLICRTMDIAFCLCTVIFYIFIARQHTDARYWYSKSVCPSVRPSVRLSVTFRYQMKTAQHIVIVSSPYGSPIILVLPASNIFKIPTGSPPAGALNTSGV